MMKSVPPNQKFFYGDAPSHVVIDNHMNESEHVVSKINREQTDFVQEESIACATSNPLFPSSPAHSPNQRDVFPHHTDSIDSLDTSDDEFAIQASSTNLTPVFLSECNTDNSSSDHPSGKTESTLTQSVRDAHLCARSPPPPFDEMRIYTYRNCHDCTPRCAFEHIFLLVNLNENRWTIG